MDSENAQDGTIVPIAYFAWGCFRYFGLRPRRPPVEPDPRPLVSAEIGRDQPGIVDQGVGRSRLHDLSGLEHIADVGGLERGTGILLDQQDRDAQVAE